MPEVPTFVIEDARLIYKNFAGRAETYNREGDRNFCVVLTQQIADELAAQGWNVKQQDPKEEGDEPLLFIKVKIGYKVRPPTIVLITNDGKTRTRLAEKDLEMVDYVDMKLVDVVCNAYDWERAEKSGRAAYLQTLVVIINEDPLERKYKLLEHLGDEVEED